MGIGSVYAGGLGLLSVLFVSQQPKSCHSSSRIYHSSSRICRIPSRMSTREERFFLKMFSVTAVILHFILLFVSQTI
jgi:hypothetical protein